MVSEQHLRDLLHQEGLSKTDRLLLILAVERDTPKTLARIRDLGRKNGVPEIQTQNISALLKATKGNAIRLPDGWILSGKGRKEILEKIPKSTGTKPTTSVATELRKHVAGVKDANTTAFLDEAIRCYEADPPMYRAAIVLSWVGAMSILYEFVLKQRLADFNAEAKRRDNKWRDARTVDGFARMKEHDFLDVIEALGIIGKNVKQELQNSGLHLRNSCGHPNSFKVGEHRAAAHLETLIQNIFSKF